MIVLEAHRHVVHKEKIAAICRAVRDAVAARCDVAIDDVVVIRPGGLTRTANGKKARSACREAYLTNSIRGQLDGD